MTPLQKFATENWVQPFLNIPCWTVTCVDKADPLYKAPINLPYLLQKGKLYGATEIEGIKPYMTLNDILAEPRLANLQFITMILNQRNNGNDIVILDIEPTCPEDIKKALMELPYLYAETSMSGKGIHAVFPAPKTYPEILETKPSVQKGMEKQTADPATVQNVTGKKLPIYEILLGRNHAVTFTLRKLERRTPPSRPLSDFYAIWEELAAQKKVTETRDLNTDNLPELKDIPDVGLILSFLEGVGTYKKDPSNFDTMSDYEFGFIGFYKYRLQHIIEKITQLQKAQNSKNPAWKPYEYSDEEKLVLLHHIVKTKIEPREKHEEERFGKTWLMWSCERINKRRAYICLEWPKKQVL